MTINEIKETIAEIEDYILCGDEESAHETEDNLMKEFIMYLADVNDSEICVTKIKNYAKEIRKVFEIEYERSCM